MVELVALGGEHTGWKWKAYGSYKFAAQDHIAPLLISELHLMAVRAPLVFVPSALGMLPCVLQGLVPSCNLFVGADGEWKLDYIPRYYEYSPFSIQQKSEANYTLCIDADCLVPPESVDGEPLFHDRGELSAKVQGFAIALLDHETAYCKARHAAKLLEKLDLLVPWEISVQIAGRTTEVHGLYSIEESRLSSLESADLKELNRSSGLYLAHCQLVSMQNLHKLVKAQEMQRKSAIPISIGSNDGLISFDNI